MHETLRSRTTDRLTIAVLFLFIVGVVIVQTVFTRREISGQVRKPVTSGVVETPLSIPADILINDLDQTIQARFLTTPQFGIYRIAPRKPVNPHFEQFSPQTDAERGAVSAFEINSWDVGIYLFGRRVTRQADTKKEKYDIRYRLFEAIPVTSGLKSSDFPDSKALVPNIKDAFVDFQKPGSANENEVRRDIGRWSFVMRPVRAANQSCVECHKDNPVVLERLGDGKFTVRNRRVGDANGVLVYAFRRRDP